MTILTQEEISTYHHDGYLVLDRPVLSVADLNTARRSIEDLLADWHAIPPVRTRGKSTEPGSPPQLAEVLGASLVDPRLARLAIVDRCRQVASELLGQRVWFHFDHAFSKQPSYETEVFWHQDQAFSKTRLIHDAVHLWIPLQDVNRENGCITYVPQSHTSGLKPHELRSTADGASRIAADVQQSAAVECPIKLGGMSAHSPMTLHASGPNSSSSARHAWVLQFGVGPWVAVRQVSRPLLSTVTRLQAARVSRSLLKFGGGHIGFRLLPDRT